jgi:hypothetical protein
MPLSIRAKIVTFDVVPNGIILFTIGMSAIT